MQTEQGSLSINSENIFPIIKKWLYSDHDIFLRELISNGCDAITKLKKLDIMGEVTIPDDYKYKIEVISNAEEKTLTVIDNGIGMTADEVKEYINQIAFSGAAAFLDKYKDKTNEDQIIGHFGLGFYSSFMVADRVTIDTLSWKADVEGVHWESEGGTEFSMEAAQKEGWGTKITLHLNEDSYEFSNEYRVKEIIEKYCSFMPVEIFFSKANAEPEYETIDASDLNEEDEIIERITEEAKTEEKESENGDKEIVEVSPKKEKAKIKKRSVSLSDTKPLWTRHPNDCTEEDYKKFFHDVFHDYKEPLFWIHLNMDYPFNLKGILYFPKLNSEYDNLEGVIKLYNNQVFIADNIKEVIPEFLLLLKGVIDCPDLPLNVSRSALQNDGFVKKISDYITKKVADKLSGMYKVEKESYEKYWDDISPFIKYGCLKDEKFREKMKAFIIFKNLEGSYLTLPEYVAAAKMDGQADGADTEQKSASQEPEVVDADGIDVETEETEEKKKDTVYYVTNEQQQSQYINLFKEQGMDALLLTNNIDQPFITQLEQGDETIRFMRIDADLSENMKEDLQEDELKEETETLTELFRSVLKKEKLEVKVERLKNDAVSSMLTLSEESRRMADMMKMYSMGGGMDTGMFGGETLVLNDNNKLVRYIFENKDSENVPMICEQLYDLAILANKPLDGAAMTNFVVRSNQIMLLLTK